MAKSTKDMTPQEFLEYMIEHRPASPVVTDPARMGKPMDPALLGIRPSGRGLGASSGGSKGGAAGVIPGVGDEASRRVRECMDEQSLVALCLEFGLDPAMVTSAPNRGVGKMRVSNAIRRILRDRGG